MHGTRQTRALAPSLFELIGSPDRYPTAPPPRSDGPCRKKTVCQRCHFMQTGLPDLTSCSF